VPCISDKQQRIKTVKTITRILQGKERNQEEQRNQLDQLNCDELLFFTLQGQCLKIKGATIEEEEQGDIKGEKRESQGILFIKEKEKSDIFMREDRPLISLIDWATIPLRKREQGDKEEDDKEGKSSWRRVNPFKRRERITTMGTRVETQEEVKWATKTKLI